MVIKLGDIGFLFLKDMLLFSSQTEILHFKSTCQINLSTFFFDFYLKKSYICKL